jgi:ABC-2 type transport system permease protein
MFAIVALVGLISVQVSHNGLWGEPHTPDVVAAADVLNLSQSEVANDLNLIVNNPEALSAGAVARRIDEDVYSAYLNLKIMDNALSAAAEIIGVEQDAIMENPGLLLENDEALNATARIMGVEPAEFRVMVEAEIEEHADDDGGNDAAMQQAMMDNMIAGMEAAAEVLGMELDALGNNMGRIKNDYAALTAMVEASGMPEEMIITIINMQLAQSELELDQPINFDVPGYINMNLGMALLLFAIGGISFLFSCVFNLTKNSLALGAGIPITFLILQIMSGASADLENLKYLSLNSLYDPSAIASGGTFIPQFIAMAVLGLVLYLIGIKVFKEKDLPL